MSPNRGLASASYPLTTGYRLAGLHLHRDWRPPAGFCDRLGSASKGRWSRSWADTDTAPTPGDKRKLAWPASSAPGGTALIPVKLCQFCGFSGSMPASAAGRGLSGACKVRQRRLGPRPPCNCGKSKRTAITPPAAASCRRSRERISRCRSQRHMYSCYSATFHGH